MAKYARIGRRTDSVCDAAIAKMTAVAVVRTNKLRRLKFMLAMLGAGRVMATFYRKSIARSQESRYNVRGVRELREAMVEIY
jgi:hypothetical protein